MSLWIPHSEQVHHEFRRNIVDEAVAAPRATYALADGARRTGLYQEMTGDVVSPFLALKPRVAREMLVSPQFAIEDGSALRVIPADFDV